MNPTTLDSIKAGAYTALWTALATFGLSATGWLADVGEWAAEWGSTGAPGDFPSLTVLASAAVSAVVAIASGIVGTLVRLAQAKTSIPGSPPVYTPPKEIV